MAVLTETIKRVLAHPTLSRARSAVGHVTVLRDARELPATTVLLSQYDGRRAAVIAQLLRQLWDLDTTALYVQVDGLATAAELVITPYAGHRVVAAGQRFRVEVETHEPAPHGAYLVERQYRRLGLYETPPAEQALVIVRITAGSDRRFLVDVPPYVSHLSVVAALQVVAGAQPVPSRGELRYHLAPGAGYLSSSA